MSYWFLVFAVVKTVVGQERFVVTTVEYSDLLGGERIAQRKALAAVRTTGAVRVNGVPGLGHARAFLEESRELLQCLEENEGEIATMADGTMRYTAAALNSEGMMPRDMSSPCGNKAWDLRLLVDAAAKALFVALDSVTESALSLEYASLSALAQHGEHLEHLHVYEPNRRNATEKKKTMMKHTDAGLMIAMVGSYGSAAELEIELPWGEVLRCDEAENDAVTFFVGDGLTAWFIDKKTTEHPYTFRPVPHALRVHSTRAWFGKMYMPPADAFIMTSGKRIQFKDFRPSLNEEASLSSVKKNGEIIDRTRILTAASATQCSTQSGKSGILCWAQCVDISDMTCSDGGTIECVDYSSGTILDGSDMCPSHSFDDCGPRCLGGSGSDTNSTKFDLYADSGSFCYGDGVTMYMDGFRSVFEKSKPLCVNIWNTKWTLDTSLKFWFGVLGSVSAGIAVEALISLRRIVHRTRTRSGSIRQYKCTPLFGLNSRRRATLCCGFFSLFLHFIQCVLGYLTMFLAMTYNVELFLSVCFGATIGHFLFNFESEPTASDPCCAAATQSETFISASGNTQYTYLGAQDSNARQVDSLHEPVPSAADTNSIENPILPATYTDSDHCTQLAAAQQPACCSGGR